MKRTALFIFALFLAAGWLSAQNSTALIEAYQRNFVRSSLGTKITILEEASTQASVNMGPLYEMAIQFVLNNFTLLQSDSQLREIAIYSVKMVQKYKYAPSIRNIWSLFLNYDEEEVRTPVLSALGDIASGDVQMIENLNSFLANQYVKFKSGSEPDYDSLEACIVALGKLGSGTSFSVLFSSYVTGYNDTIRKKAREALSLIKGDSKTLLIEVVRKNPSAADKSAALKFGLENPNFTSVQKAEIAEAALDIALGYSGGSPEEQTLIRDMRYQAVREISARKWSKASGLVVSNFYQAQTEYNRGSGAKAPLLEGIGCLGAMGTQDAAQALALYLQLINSETEAGRSYDEQIILAVINNLSLIGDKVAFDFLLYVGYLKYSETVKRAAKDALKKIKL